MPEEIPNLVKKEIPTEVIIVIKRGNNFYEKDLASVTGEEFVEWVNQVYPLVDPSVLKPENFQTRQSRLLGFEQIVQFYTSGFFKGKPTI